MGFCGCVPCGSWGLLGSWSGLPWGFPEVVRYPTKIAPFLPFGAIALPRSFQISVLRAFLGGLFGFMGLRCIFDCLVAFVWLVGLYACSVRRLRTEKRNPAILLALSALLACIALVVAFRGLSCGYCFAPVVCGFLLCCCWFSFPLDKTKKERVCFALRLYSVLVPLFQII